MTKPRPIYPLCDLVFLIMAAIYAALCYKGVLDISAGGAILDSDLQTYAQGMIGENKPDLFSLDPVLQSISPANSIPNLQRMLATYFIDDNNYAAALLKSGAIAIFVFYASWYWLGRWLFNRPAVSALLSLLAGITIWIGWGTFWGITHSDPVPRVFFAAIMPLLMLMALWGAKNILWRLAAMFATGCAMWVHGVSALNCGAMFFVAFLFIKPPNISTASHFANLLLCLIAFFCPVFMFLWPSLTQSGNFTPEQLALFHEMAEYRWLRDYSDMGKRLKTFLSPQHPLFYLVLAGFFGWLVTIVRGGKREKLFCKMCPAFLGALAAVTLFCWAESHYAAAFGRLSMGHELVRGLRFLAPLSWICIVCAIACVPGKLFGRLVLCSALTLLLIFTSDRQYIGAQYAFSQITGILTPKMAVAEMHKKNATEYREFLEEINNIVPQGEPIFGINDDMPIRYMAERPLAHAFKDGYVFFYNKDYEKSAHWLETEKTIHASPTGYLEAWEESGAPWIILKVPAHIPQDLADIIVQKNGWILAHSKNTKNPAK